MINLEEFVKEQEKIEKFIPADIRYNTDYTVYRLLDKDDSLIAYFERNKETGWWMDKTEKYKQWQKEAEEFIKKQGKLGNKKNRPASNHTSEDEIDKHQMEELYKAQ